MKALLALFVALTFTATAFAADAPCKEGQDPKKDHCTAPKK
jgi:hypothetical protein